MNDNTDPPTAPPKPEPKARNAESEVQSEVGQTEGGPKEPSTEPRAKKPFALTPEVIRQADLKELDNLSVDVVRRNRWRERLEHVTLDMIGHGLFAVAGAAGGYLLHGLLDKREMPTVGPHICIERPDQHPLCGNSKKNECWPTVPTWKIRSDKNAG